MTDGFDLTVDAEYQQNKLEATNQKLWKRLTRYSSGDMLKQLQQQMGAPAVVKSLPAKKGATVNVGQFQGMPSLLMTVTDVTDETIMVDIQRADDAPTKTISLPGPNSDVNRQLLDVHGRLQLERNSGWIKALALSSKQKIVQDDSTHLVDTFIRMKALGNPVQGTSYTSLEAFRQQADAARDVEGNLPIHLPTKDRLDEHPVPKYAKRPFANASGYFEVDKDKQTLQLTLQHNLPADEQIFYLQHQQLTLFDKTGHRLDIPFILDDLSYFDGLTHVKLQPLGWQIPDLTKIAKVETSFRYSVDQKVTHLALPLGDKSKRFTTGNIWASTEPGNGQWNVTLTGTDTANYFWEPDRDYSPFVVVLQNRDEQGLSLIDYARFRNTFDSGFFMLQLGVLSQPSNFPIRQTVVTDFKTQKMTLYTKEQSLKDPAIAPPGQRTLSDEDVTSTADWDTEDITFGDLDENYLAIALHAGIGEACQLAVEAPAEQGHQLQWQRVEQMPLMAAAKQPVGEIWQVVTDDGKHRYFYGKDITTTLRCPGTPRWPLTTLSEQRQQPWLVDIKKQVDGDIDPQLSASKFFARYCFLNKANQPLRPILNDATYSEKPVKWQQEVSKHKLADYMDQQGRIQFWGRVHAMQSLVFEGKPLEHVWHHHLAGVRE